MYKILDWFFSNYKLDQKICDISKFIKLEKYKVQKCITFLIQENRVSKQNIQGKYHL